MKKERLLNLKRLAFMLMLFVLGGQVSSKAQCSSDFTVTYDSTGTILEFHPTWTSSANVVSMLWTFGDGTSAVNQQPTHTYNFTGFATVCLTVYFTDSCSATFCDSVLTRQGGVPLCAASFTSAIAPGGVFFTDNSYSADSIVSYDWDFGDGTTQSGPNPVHVYSANGTYTVCLTITSASACTDTYCSTIAIQNGGTQCFANFSSTPILGTTMVDFIDNSTADSGATIVSYSWDFGDSLGFSSLQNPTYAYGAPGVYYVCLSIQTSSGCSSTNCQFVSAGGANSCTSNFVASLNPATNAIDFTDLSVTNDSIIRWEWDFGDGTNSVQQNPTHNYTGIGSYNVCLTITTASGCTDTYCTNVYYAGSQNCSAAFSGTISTSNVGAFYCTTNNANAQYFWSFGDGTYANGVGMSSVTHQFASAGTYVVCAAIQDSSCADSTCATFTAGSSSACAALYTFSVDSTGTTYTFTNQSTAASNYFWSFGDGTSSTDANPVHLYNQPGPHTVCLTLTDSTTGCTDTYCNSISAANACDPVFVALPDSSNPAGTPMNFTVITPCGAPASITIDYGDGSTPQTISGSNVTYVYATPGSYNVCVCVIDALGDTTCVCDTVVAYRLSNGIADLELSNIQLNAYPNPFSTTLNAEFTLEKNAVVSIQLIGLAGNVVSSTKEEKLSAGTYRESINTDDLASGFYILKLNVNGMQVSKKVALQK